MAEEQQNGINLSKLVSHKIQFRYAGKKVNAVSLFVVVVIIEFVG